MARVAQIGYWLALQKVLYYQSKCGSSLKKNITVVIVTHNMQQAARISDKTAFFYMGELIEYDETKKIFTNPDVEHTQNYITGRFG